MKQLAGPVKPAPSLARPKLLLDAEPRNECFARVFVGVETAAFHVKQRSCAQQPTLERGCSSRAHR
jgi:hypothetical protein